MLKVYLLILLPIIAFGDFSKENCRQCNNSEWQCGSAYGGAACYCPFTGESKSNSPSHNFPPHICTKKNPLDSRLENAEARVDKSTNANLNQDENALLGKYSVAKNECTYVQSGVSVSSPQCNQLSGVEILNDMGILQLNLSYKNGSKAVIIDREHLTDNCGTVLKPEPEYPLLSGEICRERSNKTLTFNSEVRVRVFQENGKTFLRRSLFWDAYTEGGYLNQTLLLSRTNQ